MHARKPRLSAPTTAFSLSLALLAGGIVADAWATPPLVAARTSAATGGPALARSSEVEALRAKYQRTPLPGPAASQAQVELGRALFFDPRLSRSSFISCASCHNPGLSWGDGLPRGIGHGMKQLGRRTPTVLNVAWSSSFFWDGRAETLAEQALGPIAAPGEMNMPLEDMLGRLRSIPGYRPLFAAAFAGPAPITKENVGAAIAAFESTVTSTDAPFDRWLKGEEAAISASAKRGFAVFNGKAECAKCHGGWRFTDDSFHDIGLSGDDKGRGALLPDLESMQHAFKTPTLRDVARRAPYMHDGSETTLEEVIELYDRGGRVRRPSLAAEVHPLKLAASEKRDLIEFIDSAADASLWTAGAAAPTPGLAARRSS